MDIDPLFSTGEIHGAVARLKADLGGERPIVAGILKGSVVLLGNLLRELDLPVEVYSVRAGS